MDSKGRFAAELVSAAARSMAAGAVLRAVGAGEPPQPFEDMRSEIEGRLAYLAEALAAGEPELFLDHIDWLRTAYLARGVPLTPLAHALHALREELAECLPEHVAGPALELLDRAVDRLKRPAAGRSDRNGAPRDDLERRYLVTVLEGRGEAAIELVREAAEGGTAVAELYGLVSRTQAEVGRMWQRGEISVAEEHYASRVAEDVVARLRPRLAQAPRNGKRALVTTVGGELHDLGARVVSDHLWAAGWDTLFLGGNTPGADVVRGVGDFDAHLLGISMSVALHVRATADLITAVKEARPDLPVLVGGRPFATSPELWRAIGADGCAASASEAVEVARRLVPTA